MVHNENSSGHGHSGHEHAEHHAKKRHEESLADASSAKSKSMDSGKNYLIISSIIMIAVLVVIFIVLFKGSGSSSGFEGDKVKVEFYVMSQCPYGTQVVDAFAPVMASMGDGIDFHLEYIVRETAPGEFQSLHGEKEVKGNIVQLCAKSHYPESYMDFIVCQNQDPANVDTNWESCGQNAGMDVATLKSCLESDEGAGLLRDSMQRTQARGATGSPTIYVNDLAYNGGRTSADFQRAVCKFSTHPACENLPVCTSDADCTAEQDKVGICVNPGKANAACTYSDPVAVDYVILNDKDCESCDTTRIVQVTQQLFLGGKPRLVDVNSEEGKALVEEYGIVFIPAYVFEPSVKETKAWKSSPDLVTAFEVVGDGKYKLLDQVVGSTYYVNEEAREAHYAGIGVVKGDNKPQIDFYVMSYCPYGNQAEELVKPVFDLLGDAAEFHPRYVVYSNYGGGGDDFCLAGTNSELCSMHGIQELNQDIREACVNKYMGIGAWFDFALAMNRDCNYQNADSCWEGVALKLGLDIDKIKSCQALEGADLMRADKKIGDSLGVQGSPTIFIDGDQYSGARTAEGYKEALCAAFEDAPDVCSQTLEEAAAAATATGNC
ncbi:thioredoxin domain-containing protein [Candidatus Woesearchaeota archaeon]|nr:thioredoxin domain-containing protein [Candidatus Woesearchaeota archaeon]